MILFIYIGTKENSSKITKGDSTNIKKDKGILWIAYANKSTNYRNGKISYESTLKKTSITW